MTLDQLEMLLELIDVKCTIAAQPQTPSRNLFKEVERLREDLRASVGDTSEGFQGEAL